MKLLPQTLRKRGSQQLLALSVRQQHINVIVLMIETLRQWAQQDNSPIDSAQQRIQRRKKCVC